LTIRFAESFRRAESGLGKCVICGKGTYKVLFSKAIEKIYICSEECLKEFHKPLGGVRIQKKLKESNGWLD
jgi:hypothetical protein